MKIYKISQDVNNDYDTFDSFVVFAKDAESARKVIELDDPKYFCRSWVSKEEDIQVEYLGEAREGAVAGQILGSFNAG